MIEAIVALVAQIPAYLYDRYFGADVAWPDVVSALANVAMASATAIGFYLTIKQLRHTEKYDELNMFLEVRRLMSELTEEMRNHIEKKKKTIAVVKFLDLVETYVAIYQRGAFSSFFKNMLEAEIRENLISAFEWSDITKDILFNPSYPEYLELTRAFIRDKKIDLHSPKAKRIRTP